MSFACVALPNPGLCPRCGARVRRMWVALIEGLHSGTQKIVCCEPCLEASLTPTRKEA